MNKYKLVIAYDGTNYGGWQSQSNTLGIQTLLKQALKTILREDVHPVGSGRTDSGVHALKQVAHFSYSKAIKNPARCLYSLNALLPEDIRILDLQPTASDFHACFSATSKIYHYHLHLNPILDPFTARYRTKVNHPIDLDLLHAAAKLFIGTHDFTSFANIGTSAKNKIRTLARLDIVEQENGLRFEFEANGFLYKMVRNIVGTLLDVASGKISLHSIPEIFAAKDRKKAGKAAPPEGLFLFHVRYGFDV